MNETLEIRVRGRVQGVGFRPHVHRLARELGLSGEVLNDADGVLIRALGDPGAIARFLDRLALEAPPLARIEALETRTIDAVFEGDFRIVKSERGGARTEVAPDAAICGACAREILTPGDRRFRYPFATCTHCGPRLSIVRAIPYDRSTTTMAVFPLCAACDAEYRDPADRRFHAEAMACPACGPSADVGAARDAIGRGEIVALKGLGGYHLACDATDAAAVARLRERKKRDAKPFALMARDLDVVRRYCTLSPHEERLLASPEAPIVLLAADGPETLPDAIAPGHLTLGFMLPTTPLHLLVLETIDGPVVMTSGNVSDAPPVIDDAEARIRLSPIADVIVSHDREIANRIDDSVVRIMDGATRVLRRARGYAPGTLRLPRGFDAAPPLLAYGGDLKSTFCLLARGEAILAQHQGDLEDKDTWGDYRKNLALYASLFEHHPEALVADLHPEYASSKLARERAIEERLPLVEVQHHHAHVGSCLAENGWPLDGPPVLGIVLDGLGLGEDDALWGGEFLFADHRSSIRLGSLAPVALLGGDQASREPWRNLYAHVMAAMGWPAFTALARDLEIHRLLADKPRTILDRMLETGLQAPVASSCGRLFDAVAAAVGIAFERQAYEGQAGAMLEAAADRTALEDDASAYPFSIARGASDELRRVDQAPMWRALLADLAIGTPPGVIAARFHLGLSRALVAMAIALRHDDERRFEAVALSGGCFQNRILFEETSRRLRGAGFAVLTHALVPPNDGGLALGQATIAAARLIASR